MAQTSAPIDLDINLVEQTLLEACARAAQITLPLFRTKSLASDNKLSTGFDPVTKADQESEIVIRQIIEKNFPNHQIIGEEHENKLTGSSFAWTIDPIDGTRAFISGLPVWGTLIGVSFEGKNFAGVMSQPYIGETFLSTPNSSTLTRGDQTSTLATSDQTQLSDAIMFTITPALFAGKKRVAYDRVENTVKLARYGCDCYAYALLASGHIDLVIEPELNSYDIAALIPLIENAGGIITTVDGGRADQGGDIIAAATNELHQAAMELYNRA